MLILCTKLGCYYVSTYIPPLFDMYFNGHNVVYLAGGTIRTIGGTVMNYHHLPARIYRIFGGKKSQF